MKLQTPNRDPEPAVEPQPGTPDGSPDTQSDVRRRMPSEIIELLEWVPRRERDRILSDPVLHASQKELYRDACAMTRAGIPEVAQERILMIRFENYYRSIHELEIENAVTNASKGAHERRPKLYPPVDLAVRADAVAKFPNALERLRAESAVREPHLLPTADVIDRLFSQDDMLCMGRLPNSFCTEPRTFFRAKEREHPFIVANPMASKWGMSKRGSPSQRCLANAGERKRIVVEYDSGTIEEQAALHLHLKSLGVELLMVVFSGSKSLHGWFDVSRESQESVSRTLRYAAYLGADTATFCPIQLVRTPNAIRDNGALQRVEFLSAK